MWMRTSLRHWSARSVCTSRGFPGEMVLGRTIAVYITVAFRFSPHTPIRILCPFVTVVLRWEVLRNPLLVSFSYATSSVGEEQETNESSQAGRGKVGGCQYYIRRRGHRCHRNKRPLVSVGVRNFGFTCAGWQSVRGVFFFMQQLRQSRPAPCG